MGWGKKTFVAVAEVNLGFLIFFFLLNMKILVMEDSMKIWAEIFDTEKSKKKMSKIFLLFFLNK